MIIIGNPIKSNVVNFMPSSSSSYDLSTTLKVVLVTSANYWAYISTLAAYSKYIAFEYMYVSPILVDSLASYCYGARYFPSLAISILSFNSSLLSFIISIIQLLA